MKHALGYLRTSSATNVGPDKDSDKRQRAAIEAGAGALGYVIVDWYYDAAVSGDVPIAERAGFNAMLDRIEGNGVRTVFVESADRFARKMLTAELGIILLAARGVTLFDARGEDLTNTDDEMRVAFRQIAMTFAQLEKTRLVKKLRAARDRKSAAVGHRIEGVKCSPVQIEAAKRLSNGLSLRGVAAAMAAEGFLTSAGTELSAAHVKRLLAH
jgi:DNA invertase Pin-like site-specific DNA recombinase